jgi:cytochrome c oxidase cbb3-type subunit 3
MSNASERPRRTDAIQGAIVHEYDGIEEADNQLPRWWVFSFIGTVIFALGYWIAYGVVQASPTPYQEYVARRAMLEEARAAELAAAPAVTKELLEELAARPDTRAEGRAVFVQQCVPCHGDKGEGKIGPNLTDRNWLHGSDAVAIHKTIADGVLAKGMPAWGAILGSKATRDVTAYLLSIRNSNVPGKPPEGAEEPARQSAL